jgi:hypothetical protein
MLEVGRCDEGQSMSWKKFQHLLSFLQKTLKVLSALDRLLDSIDELL